MREPPRKRFGSGPVRRAAPSVPAAGSPPRRKAWLLWGGLGAAAAIAAGVAGIFLLGPGPSEAPPPPVEARPRKPIPPVGRAPAGSSAAEDRPGDVEEEMRRQVEERRRKFLEEERRRSEEAARKAAEERARAEAEARARAEEEEARRRAARVAYEGRRRARREESARRLEEARRRLEEDRHAEAARRKQLAERLKDLKLSVRLKNGLVLENVVVHGLNPDEVRLAFTFEGARVEQGFPVEFIDDRSYVALLRAVYKDDGAAGLYEAGRHLVLRKLWKDAQAAFRECVALDPAYGSRVPDVSRLLNNEAAFKGSARRLGADQLVIQHDFSDPAMAQDFTVRQPGKLEVADGEMRLGAPGGTALWSLKDVDFERDVEVEFSAVIEAGASLVLGCFFTWDRNGYLAVLNGRAPGGHVLYRCDAGKLEGLVGKREPRIEPGREVRMRFSARGGVLRLHVGGEEVLAALDAAHAKGWFLLGAAGGVARVRQLSVQGRVNPAEIDKRFAEVEVLVRRALENDLGRGKEAAGKADASEPLWAEDPYFLGALDPEVRADYEKLRASLEPAVRRRRPEPGHGPALENLLARAPEFAPLHYWRGALRMAARRADLARKDFARALELEREFPEAEVGLAAACLEERDVAAARAAVRRALGLAPGQAEGLALQGLLRFLDGDAKGGLADLELARRLDPESETVAQLQKNVQNVHKGPQHLGARYVKEFPHFVVMTDMSPEKTVLYGTRLEAAYRHFAETFKDMFREDPSRPKPRVAIFNTREAYLTYGELTLSGRQEWTLGYFHPLFRELLLFEDVDLEATLQTLYHESFHQFMSLMVPRAPYWFNEGLAEYMGGIRVEVGRDGKARVTERARILAGRLQVLKMGLGMALKFEDLMTQAPAEFYSGPVSFKYAQAWSMVHFFYEAAGGRHRPRIEAYFRALASGADARGALEAAFGDADLKALEKEWLEYVRGLEVPRR